eukprot:7081782-Prymnesium_polylepis.1
MPARAPSWAQTSRELQRTAPLIFDEFNQSVFGGTRAIEGAPPTLRPGRPSLLPVSYTHLTLPTICSV